MRPLFHPRLINDPFADPGLYIGIQHAGRAILFDLGDLSGVSSREILKISHVFVSHTHMDHFAGFDRLLRLHLGRTRILHLYGPAGFCGNVAGKLAGYTWNLVADGSYPLTLAVSEITSFEIATRFYRCREGFAPAPDSRSRPFRGPLHREPGFSVNAAILDHGIPSLAFALKERFHINIVKSKMEELGLAAGPWLNEFKQALYDRADPGRVISAPQAADGRMRRYALGDLAERISLITPGQKIAYVSDAADTPENRRRILALIGGSDQLFIEAAFMEKDREKALARHHLTAGQAGEIAALAGAKQFTLFHFSPRYTADAARLCEEADRAYKAVQEPLRPT